MSSRSFTRTLATVQRGVCLLATLGLAGTTHAADIRPADSDRYEFLARLEPYHYPARYIAAFENNIRQPFAANESDTAAPLAKKPSYASEQEILDVRQQVLNDYGMLKLGYIWIVAVSPDPNQSHAVQTYVTDMRDIMNQFCNPDPAPSDSRTEPSGRVRLTRACRGGDSRFTEVIADPIGDFSVLRSQHGGGTLVSWVVGQSSNFDPKGIGSLRQKLPHGYYMVFADTIKNTLSGAEMKIVRVYKDGDERGYTMPLPPDIK